ncbi:MAG: hypothetical protein DHS20C19_12820 [Acidimicrobiales bacterium]|nr:MAG: hypothetical protein DHS20C19_12820 [Acidimicrobiales bacterium]
MSETERDTAAGTRPRLSRDAVITGAVELADEIGVDPLTLRKLAAHLGVKPMSIYHYVANKDEILDGMVDVVFSEIDTPAADGQWRDEMRRRAKSAREVLRRHPWATGMLDSRTTPGSATLHHNDAVVGCLRANGFEPALVGHAAAVIDAFVYGFALQEAVLPGHGGDELVELAEELTATLAADHPNLVWFTAEHVMQPGYHFADEFDPGLELILDGLAARLGEATS